MNNHAADNVMMLTPSLCEACVLRQRKRSSKRNVAFCVFIVYNVLVLSLVLVMLWYLFDFRDRLDRTVKTVNSLQKHDDSVTVDINKPPVEESALAITENNGRLKRSAGSDGKKNKSRHAGRKKGRRKKCKNCLPVVQIEGTGAFGKEDKTDLSDLWVTPNWLVPTGKQKHFDVGEVRQTGRIKVLEEGLYILYAQMNLIGPAIKGYEVFREENNSSPECIASCKRNSDMDYTENCFTLKVMTLAGISKRGYHIKKEQKSNRDISTIASCVNFVDEEENAKHKVRPCPIVTVVKLAKNDQVYLQEIDDNSTVLYSNTVFGLIRIGN